MLKKTLIALSLLTIALPAAAATATAPAKAPAWARADDIVCVQSASWAMATQTRFTEQGESKIKDGYTDAPNVFYYFLGRLNAQDATKNWVDAAKRDLAVNRKEESFYDRKFNECLAALADRVSGQ